MNTIALRFSDNYAPKEGTINLHNELINKSGFVWYGKFGSPISQSIKDDLLKLDEPKILLISSGTNKRFWAYIEDVKNKIDDYENVPEYYRNEVDKIKCWFKIVKFEKADGNVMSSCFLRTTHRPLSESSRHCMNPYFKIEYLPNNIKEEL
jgi:hypothetical protein